MFRSTLLAAVIFFTVSVLATEPEGDSPVAAANDSLEKPEAVNEARMECRAAYREAQNACSQRVDNTPTKGDSKSASGSDPTSPAGQLGKLYEEAGEQVTRLSQACIQAAKACQTTCTHLARTIPGARASVAEFRGQCHDLQRTVAHKHRREKHTWERRKHEAQAADELTSARPVAKGRGGHHSHFPAALDSIGNAQPASATTEQPKEQQKTPEQLRNERREQRVNALNKTFKDMNAQKSLNPALQEQMGLGINPQAAHGMQASPPPSASPSTGRPSPEPEARAMPESGDAGWIETSKKKAEERRNSGGGAQAQVSAASARGSSSPAFGGVSQFGSNDGRFEAGSIDTSLDAPPVAGMRPSDLPHMKVETPSSAGGYSAPVASGKIRGQNLAEYLPNGSRYSNRGPAGLDNPGQIRTPSVDIWQIISIRMRSRCAEGRLMDCR